MGNSGRPVLQLDVRDTSSVNFAGTLIGTSGEHSLGIKCWQFDKFAMFYDSTAEANSDNTFDFDFTVSENSTNGIDGDWAAVRRGTTASQTQADMTQITTTGTFISPLFDIPCSDDGYLRVTLTLGGSSPTQTVNAMYWILRKQITD